MVSILILAAGQSTRMRGRDKLAEVVDGVPLLRLQCQRALGTQCPVWVAVPTLNHPRMAQINDLDVQPIAVPYAEQGIGISLRTSFERIPEGHAILLCLADLVALETPDLQAVLNARSEYPTAVVWRGATPQGKPGHPILIHPDLRAEFTALDGDQGGASILKRHKSNTQLIPFADDRALLDLDTPEEWNNWRKLCQK